MALYKLINFLFFEKTSITLEWRKEPNENSYL